MLRMEDVAGGRVVDDDRLSEIAADLAKVLHVVALVVVAALTEESVVDDAVNVQLVQQGVTVF